jgi:hypothetical protein
MPDTTATPPDVPNPETLRRIEIEQRVQALRQVFRASPAAASDPHVRDELDRAETDLAAAFAAEWAVTEAAGEKPGSGEAAGRHHPSILSAVSTGLAPSVEIRMPTLPTGMYHLFDPATSPLAVVEVKVKNQFKRVNGEKEIARLLVRARLEGISTEHAEYREVRVGGSTGPLNLLPTLLPENVRRITEVQRAALQIVIDDMDGKTEYRQTFTILMLSRNSGLSGLWDVKKNKLIEDLTPYYGAWVTPNADSVMRLLRKVVDKTSAQSLRGYLTGSAKVVDDEVRAIYDVLKDERIVYVNSAMDFGRTESQSGQRVRLPRESLDHKTANCLDGAVLFASLMQANSLNPGLVFVPGHALVAWQNRALWGKDDPDSELLENWDYLETTMVSTAPFEEAKAKGREIAERYFAKAGGKQDDENFRLHRLTWLRARGIFPME